MPYIRPESRQIYNDQIDELSAGITNVGELNYVITRLCHKWILKYGKLSCVTQEFYRVVVSDYEDLKRAENGSVSSLDDDTIEIKQVIDATKEKIPECCSDAAFISGLFWDGKNHRCPDCNRIYS